MKATHLLLVLVMTCTASAAAAESRCPLIPMGAITGKPDEQTVKETLEAYKSVGVDQYLIYARSGLEYEYMGDEWLQMCQWFCKHAKRLNVTIWLYEEDEPCDQPLIFAFEGASLKEEQSGRVFTSPDEAAVFAEKVCPPAAWVETADGKTVEDVLLRHYQDGSVAVLGLTAKEHGKLRLMRRDGEPIAFELPARGVFRLEGTAPASKTEVAIHSFPACSAFDIALSASNTHRLAFDSDNTRRITVDHAVAGARLVLRHHPVPSEVMLDGMPVRADQPCTTLRPGLNELYRQTELFRLEAGEHELAIRAGGGDTNSLLPIAWVTGGFAVESGTIKALPRTVGAGPLWRQGLADFAGRVTYTAQVDIPSHAGNMKLRVNTGGLFTSVTLDGHAMGERAWAPFEFAIPAGIRSRKAKLKISIWTSVAPMFGDWRNPHAAWNKSFCVPPPDPHPNIGLLSVPAWVLS